MNNKLDADKLIAEIEDDLIDKGLIPPRTKTGLCEHPYCVHTGKTLHTTYFTSDTIYGYYCDGCMSDVQAQAKKLEDAGALLDEN